MAHWLPELFAKNKNTNFLDSLEIFRLDMGQISSNLLKKAFATWQYTFLSASIIHSWSICLVPGP